MNQLLAPSSLANLADHVNAAVARERELEFRHPFAREPVRDRTLLGPLWELVLRPLEHVEEALCLRDEQTEAQVWNAVFQGQLMQCMTVATHGEQEAELSLFLSSFSKLDAWQREVRRSSSILVPAASWDLSEAEKSAPLPARNDEILDPKLLFELAEDFSFNSPILARPVIGKPLAEKVFSYASQVYGERSYGHKVQVGAQVLSLWTAKVAGLTLDVANVLHFNARGQCRSMDMFMRPWPVVTLFRSRCQALTKHFLDASYFEYS